MRTSFLIAFVSALCTFVHSQSVGVTLEITANSYYRNDSITTGPRPVFDGRLCDAGSNSATPTTALVEASEQLEFSVQSRFDETIDDYIITDIEYNQENETHHWNTYVNGVLVTNGGCHTAINGGDYVLFSLEPHTN